MAYPERSPTGTISSSPGPSPDEKGEARFGDPDASPGPLLHADKARVAKLAHGMWEARESSMRKRIAQWEVNAHHRMGVMEARVKKEQDRHIAYIPDYVTEGGENVKTLNKGATLARKLINQLLADPPAPSAIPSSGADEDVQAAEWATRVLEDLQGEAALYEPGAIRKALDKAVTHASGFVRYWVDPRAGGREPLEIQAGVELDEQGEIVREADHFDIAETDPATGTGWHDYRPRYVRPDGSLTTEKKEAATRWVPGIRREVLTGTHVRMIPETAEDLWDAQGVQIASYVAWGELREMWPDLAKLSADETEKLLRFRPKGHKALLPGGVKLGSKSESLPAEDEQRDEVPVFCLTTIYKAGEKYPDGLYLVTLGNSFMAHRENWIVEDGELREPLEIPLTQYKLYEEGTDDPYGYAFMQLVGPGNEIRAAQLAAVFDHLDDLSNVKTFIPTTSNLSGRDLSARGRYLNVIPGGEPRREQLPDFPQAALEVYRLVSDEMDTVAGLTTEDVNSANSGRHAYAMISAAHAGLSEPRQHIERGYVRGCRIVLQLTRAFFDKGRQLRWFGEDNSYKHKAWSASDLRTTRDVRLAAGSLTLLTPAQKGQFAEHLQELKLLQPGELRDTLSKSLGGMLSLQDDPHRNRIRRQLAEWHEGPPSSWREPEPDMLPEPGEPDALVRIWESVPGDFLPQVASVRLEEIARFMASTRYMKHSRAWRAGVIEEYQRMYAVLNPPAAPPPEAPVEQPPAPAAMEGAPPPVPEDPVEFGITPPDQMPPEVMGTLPAELQAQVPTDELPVM